MNDTIVPIELQTLSDKVGAFVEFWGFKRIHGEIWTHIWLCKGPISATNLVKRLGVSKALVSLALKDLIEQDVVQIVGQDRKRILLQANPNIEKVIATILKNRESKMLHSITIAATTAHGISPDLKIALEIDAAKLDKLQELSQLAQSALNFVIQNQLKN